MYELYQHVLHVFTPCTGVSTGPTRNVTTHVKFMSLLCDDTKSISQVSVDSYRDEESAI